MKPHELIIDCAKVLVNLTPYPNLFNILKIADKIGREQGNKPMMKDETYDKIQSITTIHFSKIEQQKQEWRL